MSNEQEKQKTLYLVLISHKRTSRKYMYSVTDQDTALAAQIAAWNSFRGHYPVHGDDWSLLGFEVVCVEQGPQQIMVLDW